MKSLNLLLKKKNHHFKMITISAQGNRFKKLVLIKSNTIKRNMNIAIKKPTREKNK